MDMTINGRNYPVTGTIESEELGPILDYKRNYLFPSNNGSKCEWNISVYCSDDRSLGVRAPLCLALSL